jgi:hypothetical protein
MTLPCIMSHKPVIILRWVVGENTEPDREKKPDTLLLEVERLMPTIPYFWSD